MGPSHHSSRHTGCEAAYATKYRPPTTGGWQGAAGGAGGGHVHHRSQGVDAHQNEREKFFWIRRIFLLTSIFAAHPLKILFHPTSTSSMYQPPEPRSSPPSHALAPPYWSLITPARSISTPRKHGRNLISAGTLSWMSPFTPAGGHFMGTRSVANMKP